MAGVGCWVMPRCEGAPGPRRKEFVRFLSLGLPSIYTLALALDFQPVLCRFVVWVFSLARTRTGHGGKVAATCRATIFATGTTCTCHVHCAPVLTRT
jgi:hypothetical protein